jgi:hypothetical protein
MISHTIVEEYDRGAEVTERKKASGFDDRPPPSPVAPSDGVDRPDRAHPRESPFDAPERTRRRRQAPDDAAEVLTAAAREQAHEAVIRLRQEFPLPEHLSRR